MSSIINKSLILKEIKNKFNFKNDTEFASFLGIKPQTLSSWHTRNTFDIELLYAKCVNINPEWLLTGKGEMLKPKKEHSNEFLDVDVDTLGESKSFSLDTLRVKNYKNKEVKNVVEERSTYMQVCERCKEKDKEIASLIEINNLLKRTNTLLEEKVEGAVIIINPKKEMANH